MSNSTASTTSPAGSYPSSSRPPPRPSTTSPVPSSAWADVRAAVTGAMAAWGRFAVTGDLEEVSSWFAPDGPQYRQFEEEAERLESAPIGPPPYTVLVEDLDVEEWDGGARAEGGFVFVRTGEPSQSFHWVIELTRRGGRWQVWTVTTIDSGG